MLTIKEMASMSPGEMLWWILTTQPIGQLLLLMAVLFLGGTIASEVVAHSRRKQKAALRQRFEAEFSDMPETERMIHVYLAIKAKTEGY